MNTIEWVNCPICDDCDMEKTIDGEGNVIINCVNHACASNGGDNCSGIFALVNAHLHKKLKSISKIKNDIQKSLNLI